MGFLKIQASGRQDSSFKVFRFEFTVPCLCTKQAWKLSAKAVLLHSLCCFNVGCVGPSYCWHSLGPLNGTSAGQLREGEGPAGTGYKLERPTLHSLGGTNLCRRTLPPLSLALYPIPLHSLGFGVLLEYHCALCRWRRRASAPSLVRGIRCSTAAQNVLACVTFLLIRALMEDA